MTKKKSAVIIFTSFTLAWGAHALGLLNGFGAAQTSGVTSLSTYVGAFFLNGGLSTNEVFNNTFPPGPWATYRPITSNVISQLTGPTNALRNGSMTSWQHYKFETHDAPDTYPQQLGIASFTVSGISGTTMTVTGTPTGVLKPWQRVTDTQNFVTTASSAVSTTTLTFADTTGIAAGMHVTNLTHPRSIAGNITVASLTGTVVTLSGDIGFTGNTQMIGSPGVSSGDTIAFGAVKRGTSIVRQLTGTTGAAGTYEVSVSQTHGGATMQSAGGWGPEGVYIIPVGTAGTSNYVTCFSYPSGVFPGAFAPSAVKCNTVGSLDNIIIRFPMDHVDASRIQCGTYTGGFRECISANIYIQPVTFQLNITYSDEVTTEPTFTTRNPCPLSAAPGSGLNSCPDDWTFATTDVDPVTFPPCDSGVSNTPVTCTYGYTWMPTGVQGGYIVEFHTNAFTDAQSFIIQGFDLKQTPGATCLGDAPPCFQWITGPIEVPDAVADMHRNMRFTQTIGSGWSYGWNGGGSLGATESTMGFAYSTTQFIATWPLPVAMRCDTWKSAQKAPPSCPVPHVYFMDVGDYYFQTSAAEFTATALATGKIGTNSLQVIATSSGMTAGTPGYVYHKGNGLADLILIDSSIIGD